MQTVSIYDTTLRDGLRNSGVTISVDDRVRFARQLERLGVDAIEVGFGGPSQVETMAALAGAVRRPAVFGLTRPHRRDRERVMRALERAATPGVNIFCPTSDRFLGYLGWDRGQALERVSEAVRHVRGHAARVVFSTQDASGADPEFAQELIGAAIDAGADTVSISDTTSRALPAEFGALCSALRRAAPDRICWSVHCHDDLGLAVANCLAAIEQGVRQIECTVAGLGEGAGNTSLGRIARVLESRADAFPGLRLALDPDELEPTGALLADICQPASTGHSDVLGLLTRWRRD